MSRDLVITTHDGAQTGEINHLRREGTVRLGARAGVVQGHESAARPGQPRGDIAAQLGLVRCDRRLSSVIE